MDTLKWLKTELVQNLILINIVKNEDIGDNESGVLDSDLDSSDIEVYSVGSFDIFNDHTDFGDGWNVNGLNTVNGATVIANANIPNWITNFTDITVEPFTQNAGPSLPKNFDVSVATALDYFILLFKLGMFSDTKNKYAIIKQGLTGYCHKFIPAYTDLV